MGTGITPSGGPNTETSAIRSEAGIPGSPGPGINVGGSSSDQVGTPEAITSAAEMIPNPNLSWDEWNKIGMAMLTKLKVYGGPDHPHQAQQVKPLEL